MLQAMILAAGRGERMRPLTDTVPKPLQTVYGKPLIFWQVQRLAAAGFTDLVINHAWLGDQIEAAIGDGARWGVTVRWSREGTALGTAGGVATALPLLTAPAFALVSADLYTTYDYARLKAPLAALTHEPQGTTEAHLVLVKNTRYPRDFSLHQQRVVKAGQDAGTYGNIGVFRRRFFEMLAPGQPAELGPLLHAAVARGALSGEWLEGRWANVGTAADLEQLQSSGIDPNLGTDPHGAPSPGEQT